MKARRVASLFLIGVFTVVSAAGRANAGHVLDTGSGYQSGPLYVTFTGVNGGNPFFTTSGAIGLPPNFGSVDGRPVPYLYCVEIFTNINVRGVYGVDLSNNGIVHGGLIANAGQIAWLMDHIAPTATTQDAQEGLQAAIWKQVYGASFNIAPPSDGTGAGIFAAYNADIAALGSNTAPVSDVLWLSPYNRDGSPAQGLITNAVPEPSTLALASLGGFVLLGYTRRMRIRV